MADLPNARDLFAVGRRSIVNTPGLKINPRVIDVPGSDVNIALGAMAAMGENIVAAIAACMRGLYIETAPGAKLDRTSFDKFQATRLPASPATTTVVLTRPTNAFGAFTYQAGSRLQTEAGTQFATDVDAVFSGAALTTQVTVTALEAGPAGNVKKDTITKFVDTPADSSLTVNNPDQGNPLLPDFIPGGAAGGTEAETDSEYRARLLDFFGSIRRGVLGAIEYGVRLVPGVAVVRAYETVNTGGTPGGSVQVVIADRDGGFSQNMLTAVRDKLVEFRAAGIPVWVNGGVVVEQPVSWALTYLPGVNQAQAQAEVRAITVAVTQFLRPGETLYRASLIAAARTVPGVVISNESLVLPVGDTVPPLNTQLLRTPPESVSFV